MKRVLLIISLIILFGCRHADYKRSNEKANIYLINMEEISDKIENKETFMFMMARVDCANCLWIQETVLYEYLLDHGFDFYKVELPNDIDHPEAVKAIEFVEEHPNPEEMLPEGDYSIYDVLTPTFYFIENGEIKDIYIGGDMTTEMFDGYIQKYRLDEVK